MNSFIKVGGFGVIAAIFCIFLFILWQIIPLFLGAETKLAGKLILAGMILKYLA